MNEQLKEPINRVLALLVTGQYPKSGTLTHGNRLSAKEIATAVTQHGRTLIIPPEDAYGLMNVVEVENAQPKRWLINCNAALDARRRPIQLDFRIDNHQTPKTFEIELDDVHVF